MQNDGAPKNLWLIPIIVSISAAIWVLLAYSDSIDTGDREVNELIRATTVAARISLGMAASVISYVFVSSIDRMMR